MIFPSFGPILQFRRDICPAQCGFWDELIFVLIFPNLVFRQTQTSVIPSLVRSQMQTNPKKGCRGANLIESERRPHELEQNKKVFASILTLHQLSKYFKMS